MFEKFAVRKYETGAIEDEKRSNIVFLILPVCFFEIEKLIVSTSVSCVWFLCAVRRQEL